jgi:hypothetical protein
MIIGDGGASADALHMLLPRERDSARAEAVRLARRLEFLTWQERAKVLDDFFWDQAKSRLDNERVTAVINRQGHGRGHAAVVGTYARYCRAVVTTALVELAEPARAADGEAAALAYRLSLLAEHQDAPTWRPPGPTRRAATGSPAPWPPCPATPSSSWP